MRRSRCQLTLGPFIQVVAALAVLFTVLSRTPWSWSPVLVTAGALHGFAIDRRGGGHGIVGAMLASATVFVGIIVVWDMIALFARGYSPLLREGLIGPVIGLALLGLCWGLLVGSVARLFLWTSRQAVALVRGRIERPGPIACRGPEDQELSHPRAGARPS